MKFHTTVSLLFTAGFSTIIAFAQVPDVSQAPPTQMPPSASLLEGPQAVQTPESNAPFVPVPTGTCGLVEEGIAGFYPQGIDAKKPPISVALFKRPVIARPLPASWVLRPEFSTNGEKSRATIKLSQEVDLYGEGECVGPLRRNGTSIKLWNTDNYGYSKDNGKRLYQAHPWIMGVRQDGTAFGVIFDSTWKAELSCKEGIIFEAIGPAFPVYVIERSSPEGVLKGLGELTGRMELPPLWALGYQQCRYSYYPDARVREIADEFRSRKLPCDVIWLDIHYMDAYRIFTFDPQRFPDPGDLNRYLHSNGFKSVWMIDPGIKVDPAYPIYSEGRRQNLFVQTAEGKEYNGEVWPGPCAFPDFTMPQARQWWSSLYQDFVRHGVDGVWNDMNEPAVFRGPDGTMPEDNLHRGGAGLPPGPHRQYHNVYGMLMVKATRDGILAANPNKRPFVLSRANFLGGQRYAAAWTGDNRSTEDHMKLSVPMSLSLGLSGQPFNGPDMGGFGGNATPDLWGKWVGTGALFPFARGHADSTTKPKEPWVFGPKVEATSRIAFERRYRLLPYLYTLFREASVDGLPVMRPIFMADSKALELRREQNAFLLGADLMVIPAWAKNPTLPAQPWPRISIVDGDLADLDQATLRIRPGAIIPMGKIIQNTTEPSLDPLTLLVCLDEKGEAEGRLYEDAGDGFGYRSGDYALTTFRAKSQNGKTIISVVNREGKRPATKRQAQIQVVRPDGGLTTFNQIL